MNMLRGDLNRERDEDGTKCRSMERDSMIFCEFVSNMREI